ncbi:unnamed protein product [Ambrosiozyma monospora]|uniref:Unnamed protein product n=1 Tax=Ambrosiozyma monospora TaxID=43982 RepID=A0ACB5UCF2_AMBMO|nr:unnamed protein product [Ambrosiozyma monospora]
MKTTSILIITLSCLNKAFVDADAAAWTTGVYTTNVDLRSQYPDLIYVSASSSSNGVPAVSTVSSGAGVSLAAAGFGSVVGFVGALLL